MSRRRARRRNEGFTLLELMVALAIGTLVVATMYTLGGASARTFQEQQRITQLQLATRIAIDRIRRDVALAGFGGSPNPVMERSCGAAGPAALAGLQVFDADAEGPAALATMPGFALVTPAPQTDRIRIVGNLVTADTYLIANTGNAAANQVLLQSSWQGFRRSFASGMSGVTTTWDTELFAQVFTAGRWLRISDPRGFTFFTQVTTAALNSSGTSPQININPPLPAAGQCNFALCVGCTLSPLVAVDYLITAAPPGFVPRDPAVTGTNTVLMRRDVNPLTGATLLDPVTGQRMETVVLEYAVELSAVVAMDTAAVGLPPNIQWLGSGAPVPRPHDLRAAHVELSARSQEVDTAFQGPIRSAEGTLTGFPPFVGQLGMSRVRTAVADIVLENYAFRRLGRQ